jgi:parallel beta-helix repeat protein
MYRSFILFLLALLSLTAPAWASVIYVSGDQTGTWSADTVIVTAEVRVPPSMSLTILPGVEVLFSVYCKFIVDSAATLRAVGTAADSIRFDVLPPDTAWHGIRFLSASDSSRLEYCIMTHGSATGSGEDIKGGAIYCSSSSPTISGNTISDNACPGVSGFGGGICCVNNSNPNISNNIISGNSAICTWQSPGLGGGIYCDNSSPSISGNTINGDTASFGGGICCTGNSNPSIIGNTIGGNRVFLAGGGIYCDNSSPIISGNTISGNIAMHPEGGGTSGGICCLNNSNPIISGNTISENSASSISGGGGGIECSYSSPSISDNIISRNSAGAGGGICFTDNSSNPSILGNTISGNLAYIWGGGIYSGGGSPIISGNTISGNSALWLGGGGIFCEISSPTLVNCILWANRPQQIFVSSGSPQMTYSDIEGGYTGAGNINAWPAFVDTAQDDYRLQWGSPCIDTGDPNPIYNDPDGTIADMGAWYYDQTMPVRILLTPYNAPIQIPVSGGSFQYAIQVTNIGSTTLPILVWCDVTLPSGTIYGPVLGPLVISLVGQTFSRLRTQVVPAGAPAGMYHYNAYAVAAGDTSSDSFVFTKAVGFGESDLQGGWTNAGEGFEASLVGASAAADCAPTAPTLKPVD